MASAMAASSKARLLFNFIIFVLPIAAWNIPKTVLRAWLQRLPVGLSAKNAFLHTYRQWAISVGFRPEIETLSDNATRLMWLGSPKSEKVILFFHGKLSSHSQRCAVKSTDSERRAIGGGYVMPLSEGHLNWMVYTSGKCRNAGLDVSVAILEYDLIPKHPYPRQMIQGIIALKSLLSRGYSPNDIIIGGDSAGGHLSLSLLSHLHHPRPESDLIVELKEPLRGCFLVSPLVSLSNLETRSYNERCSADVLSKNLIREWGDALIKNSPWREEIRNGLGWGMALDVPEKWWQGFDIAKRIIVTGGHEEIFRDHITAFIEVLRRNASVHLTSHMALDEAHDGPLMEFRSHCLPGSSTKALTEWIIATFSEDS
ncbi:hypothetical protein AOR_1_832114 [Paecilomyces variotii No. 5]|uniref:Alpha/beta hydrolase fold-3 domain-containing protein n=1 Tax=Byssochlamys spectabilis (strain No. 5 / NBRC 109023) TaxID=1356009 RepID=V5GBX1_BYSSN|nr:hypothetical protein AOR_1_832114 [Paecilomyces variotii No. 5]